MFKGKWRFITVLAIVTMVAMMLAGCGGSNGAQDDPAANFPEGPIQLVVPWNAGGDTDVVFRIIAKHLEDELGQTIVIVNKGGASGAIGAAEVKDAKADGYTLLAGHDSIPLSLLTGATDFGYEVFEPVALMVSTPELVATSVDNPWNSVEDLVQQLKEDPKSISFGASLGSTSHLTPAAIEYAADVKFNTIGYEGTAQRMTALLGKHIDLGSTSISAAKEYLAADKLKILGVMAEERIDALPDVPTLKELGYEAYNSTNRGIFAPQGTPPEIVNKISEALGRVAQNPDFQEEMDSQGVMVNYKNAEEYKAWCEDEQNSIGDIVEKTGMKSVQ